jgi:predicted phosphodiesterase
MKRLMEDHRIAILADIHGNSFALDAVFADIDSRGGVHKYWFFGDYAAIGFDPVGVLERISSIENARFIRGNTDKYIVENSLPWPNWSDVEDD